MVVIRASLTVDSKVLDLPTRAHNMAGKTALRQQLEIHHANRIPGHFRTTARSKYSYQPRSPGYKAHKREAFRSITDLVRTGSTERRVRGSYQIRIGGTIAGRLTKKPQTMTARVRNPELIGNLVMRFPFPVSRDNKNPRAVTIRQMADEITAVTQAEQSEIAAGFERKYTAELNRYRGNKKLIYGRKTKGP